MIFYTYFGSNETYEYDPVTTFPGSPICTCSCSSKSISRTTSDAAADVTATAQRKTIWNIRSNHNKIQLSSIECSQNSINLIREEWKSFIDMKKVKVYLPLLTSWFLVKTSWKNRNGFMPQYLNLMAFLYSLVDHEVTLFHFLIIEKLLGLRTIVWLCDIILK